ncbi:MAG: hypothetical protein Q7U14_01515 [Lacisediminimonas sp.]|nr:hypothetical protein [Lacisediminimonas sp.]
MAADIFHASVERLEAWAHENEESLRSEIEKPGRIAGELNLRLSFDDENRAMLTEPTYRIGFRTDLRLRTTGHLVSVVSDVPLVA